MANEFQLKNRIGNTIPVTVDGVAYRAQVGSAGVATAYTRLVKAVDEAVRGLKGIAGKDVEGVLAAVDAVEAAEADVEAKAREALAAMFGAEAVPQLLGDGPVGIDGATAAARLIAEVAESPEYRKALGRRAKARAKVAGR